MSEWSWVWVGYAMTGAAWAGYGWWIRRALRREGRR